MAKKKHQEQGQRTGAEERTELPPGVKLLRTLEGHQEQIWSVAFDPQGETLASGSDDNTVKLWEARSGKLLRTLEGHKGESRAWRLIRRARRWPAGVGDRHGEALGGAKRQAAPHAQRAYELGQ